MTAVRTAREGAVVTLVLDDEKRKNAMSPELGDALARAVREVAGDRSVRAVVLTGAGDAFSAGGDLAMLERLRRAGHDEARAFMLGFYGRYLSILDLEVPVIAAVRGAAIGAGLAVAMACDLVVVDEDAKLALNFAALGLHPGMGATYFAPRRVGAERARELLFTGRRFDGREAVRMGMALEAVPAAEVVPRAQRLASAIADSAPLAVRALKRELGVDRDALAAALAREATEQAVSYASRDLGEGLAAASEKRKPRFEGA
jgi:enoyl-CoA hydratase/carnithine racemase